MVNDIDITPSSGYLTTLFSYGDMCSSLANGDWLSKGLVGYGFSDDLNNEECINIIKRAYEESNLIDVIKPINPIYLNDLLIKLYSCDTSVFKPNKEYCIIVDFDTIFENSFTNDVIYFGMLNELLMEKKLPNVQFILEYKSFDIKKYSLSYPTDMRTNNRSHSSFINSVSNASDIHNTSTCISEEILISYLRDYIGTFNRVIPSGDGQRLAFRKQVGNVNIDDRIRG